MASRFVPRKRISWGKWGIVYTVYTMEQTEGIAMDKMTKEQRFKVMQHNRGRDTKPELLLRKALWHRGLRYRKNYKALPGTPDIVLTRQHIAVFVDGDFWHGHGQEDNPAGQIRTNREFWRKKISRNIERDREVNDTLTESGWLVLRFWESEIRNHLDGCVRTVLEYAKPKGAFRSSAHSIK